MKSTTVLAIGLSFLLGMSPAVAQTATTCEQMVPYGAPQVAKADTTKLCRISYTVLHDNQRKTAIYSAELLLKENLNGKTKRVNAFKADPDLPAHVRADLNDYNKAYDRGHLVPFEDSRKDSAAALQTFYLSNIVPQNLHLNRGMWRQIENKTRGFAYKATNGVYVITGPVYQGKIKFIGEGVAVPTSIYKVIINKQTQQGVAYMVPNRGPKKHEKYEDYKVTIKTVEDATGINFTPQYPNAVFKHMIGAEFK